MEPTNQALPDYQNWLSKFLCIYRYHHGTDLTNTALATDYLAQQNFAQSDLDEIWRHHVARNIYRDKQVRDKRPIKRDSHNILLYLKKKLYLDPIPTSDDWKVYDNETCVGCKSQAPKDKVGHWIIVGSKWFCCRCYTLEFEGVKETSISVLREAYKTRTPQLPNERLTDYLKRALRMGAANMKERKTNKQENDQERELERQAIQGE